MRRPLTYTSSNRGASDWVRPRQRATTAVINRAIDCKAHTVDVRQFVRTYSCIMDYGTTTPDPCL